MRYSYSGRKHQMLCEYLRSHAGQTVYAHSIAKALDLTVPEVGRTLPHMDMPDIELTHLGRPIRAWVVLKKEVKE